MIASDRIRQQGFEIRPAGTGIYIDPIDNLKPEQRQWIAENKSQIRQQLLTERWLWFLSLATEHGIHPDAIEAQFATEQDRIDVVEPIEHTDEILTLCMATLCKSLSTKH